ncbi:hypothetical protein ABMA27_008594 [Loxostege sticticalis]|uniref:CRAL-TRIO domain-containing protein n=2 Tax=Loxostege sticticalis TaxID=481309 RepID=A0ABR3HBX2_LOXSC
MSNKMASAATLVQPSGEMWKKIRVELNEDVNTRDRDVEAIKEWLRKQPHLPDEWDTQRITTFLRGCNFSMEKCKRKLDMYFTMRAACPEFFTNRDMSRPELRELMTNGQAPPLPGLTPEGRRVIIARGHDLDTHQLNDAFKIAMMIGDIRLKEEIEGVAGDVYILDASVVNASHIGRISIPSVKKFLICVQEAYPVKLKEVHVVNASPLIDAVVTMIKPFLKEKIRNRIFIHTEMESLQKYIPKDILPEEYGGDAGPVDVYNEAWIKKLEDYTDWFKSEESVKANEALRPGKPTNYDELFGIEGSFRQLSID